MKKILALLMAIAMVLSLAACTTGGDETESSADGSTQGTSEATDGTEATDPSEETDDPSVKSEGVMTYAEYIAAELDTEVVIEAYVQAHQSWWDEQITVYAQDADGAYFLYNMACSEEDSEKLVAGTKIRVTGYKSEWSGEVEIIDATFEILEGSYIAEATDVTDLLRTDDQID